MENEREATMTTILSLRQRHANLMISAKAVLDMDPFDNDDEDDDKEYSQIVKLMEKYIRKHCDHVMEYDEIDIDPDRSKSIQYCSRCMLTFK